MTAAMQLAAVSMLLAVMAYSGSAQSTAFFTPSLPGNATQPATAEPPKMCVRSSECGPSQCCIFNGTRGRCQPLAVLGQACATSTVAGMYIRKCPCTSGSVCQRPSTTAAMPSQPTGAKIASTGYNKGVSNAMATCLLPPSGSTGVQKPTARVTMSKLCRWTSDCGSSACCIRKGLFGYSALGTCVARTKGSRVCPILKVPAKTPGSTGASVACRVPGASGVSGSSGVSGVPAVSGTGLSSTGIKKRLR